MFLQVQLCRFKSNLISQSWMALFAKKVITKYMPVTDDRKKVESDVDIRVVSANLAQYVKKKKKTDFFLFLATFRVPCLLKVGTMKQHCKMQSR